MDYSRLVSHCLQMSVLSSLCSNTCEPRLLALVPCCSFSMLTSFVASRRKKRKKMKVASSFFSSSSSLRYLISKFRLVNFLIYSQTPHCCSMFTLIGSHHRRLQKYSLKMTPAAVVAVVTAAAGVGRVKRERDVIFM